jgi:hypothetical protein
MKYAFLIHAFFIGLILQGGRLHGQLLCPRADDGFSLCYHESLDTAGMGLDSLTADSLFSLCDTVFVFYSPDELGRNISHGWDNSLRGQVEATYLDTSASDSVVVDFTWTQFNKNTLSFDTVKTERVPSDTNFAFSVLNLNYITTPGSYGYKLYMRDTLTDSVSVKNFWVFVDHLGLAVNDEDDKCNCDYLLILESGYTLELTDFVYVNLYQGPGFDKDTLLNKVQSYKWIHDNGEIKSTSSTLEYHEIGHEDIEFELNVTDHWGNSVSAYYDYIGRVPKAEVNIEKSNDQNFAPLKVTFNSISKLADSIKWLFGDTLSKGFDQDTIYTAVFDTAHTYFIPTDEHGPYVVSVVVKNNRCECTDSISLEGIEVVASTFELDKEAFSPNVQDGTNDEITFSLKSIKDFHLVIFNRWGRVVFEKEIYNNTETEEIVWDGKIRNSNRTAEPGVYYYVIKAKGYDGNDWDGKPKEERKGSLFGGQNSQSNQNTTGNQNNQDDSGQAETASQAYGVIYVF